MEILQTTKKEISENIQNDEYFKAIINVYKNTENTTGYQYNIDSDNNKSGLTNTVTYITLKDKLYKMFIPVFSTEKTITQNLSYLNKIKEFLPKEYLELTDEQIINTIMCPLYYLDKYTGQLIFLQIISLNDQINNGIKGKNSPSVYFQNDKLPNQYSKVIKDLRSEIFVDGLVYLDDKQIKTTCDEFAVKYFKKFAPTDRTDETKIKNISDGLYAQLKVYLFLLKCGYNVQMDWYTKDDLGIDIIFNVHGESINIDVKSTRDEWLKISKNRKETHFYAVTTQKNNEIILEGFLHKYDFQPSDILKTSKPTQDGELYKRKLTKEYRSKFLKIEDLFVVFNNYKLLKMKRGQKLFDIQ